jgi:Zn-dependent protease
MKASVQIGRIIGIPIKIHFTFLIILALFAWSFSTSSVTIFGFIIGYGVLILDIILKVILGIVLAILLFACVILHELGHSYVTQQYGYKINEITLFIFGGVSQAEEIPQDPRMELKIAVVGPLISLLLGGAFYGSFLFINSLGTGLAFQAMSITVGTLAFYNVLLGLFNLIPAFPIDGGRVLRSLLASRMDYGKATRIASNVGKVFAIAIAVFGIFYNIWFILIAVFIYIGAAEEDKALQISIALEKFTVNDLMTHSMDAVSPSMTLHDFSDYMFSHKHLGYPVMENKQILGMMTIKELHGANPQKRDTTTVRDVMRTDVLSISKDEPAISAFKIMMKQSHESLIVKDHEEVLGIISWTDLLRPLQMKGA